MPPDLEALRAQAWTGEELLCTAARVGDIPALRALASEVTPEQWRSGWQRNAIFEARSAGAAQALISAGADVLVASDSSVDPLEDVLAAFDLRDPETKAAHCDVLLSAGLQLELPDGRRLLRVCERQMAGGLRWLLNRGHSTSPEILNECLLAAVRTPWYPCSEWGEEIRQTLQLLVAAGADPNSSDVGFAALFWAASECADSQEQSLMVMEELIRLGADPFRRCDLGWTTLDWLISDADSPAAEEFHDFLFDGPSFADRLNWAEHFLKLHPKSPQAVPIRFLVEVMRSRLQP